MQKKFVFATTAAVVVMLAGAFTYKVYAERNNGIAAVVNGEQITVAEIKEAYEQTPQIKAQVSFDEFYGRALDVMVNSKLALQQLQMSKPRRNIKKNWLLCKKIWLAKFILTSNWLKK